MSRQSLEEIADLLLTRASSHGATAADVLLAEGDSLSVAVRLGHIEKVKRARAKHLGLRVFVGERSAISSTADFDPPTLESIAEETVALARVTSADPCGGLAQKDELASAPPDLDLYDPGITNVTAEQATEWCKAAEIAALAVDTRLTNSDGAEFDCGTHNAYYAATNDFRGGYRTSYCSLVVSPIASQNGSMQRDYWYSAHHHLGKLEAPDAIGRRAAARALRRLGARKVRTCEVPVVFDPDMASSLLAHLAGAVSGNALYKGMSFLVGKLGEPIAPSFITIDDDGRLRDGLGSKPFDAEGVATRRTAVVDGGVLRNYLFDCYSARKMESRSTGNAARSIVDSPHVSPTNFVLQPGSDSPEAIIGSVRSGLYVTELMGFGVNPVTGDYSRGASGIWIENGELTYAVEEITIAGNLLEMLRQIEVVGNDLSLRRSIAAPTLKIAKLTVAGA